jgi:hypothetical protein
MSSGMNSGNDTNHKLLALGKSVSCDNLKANSCIELADIRKLDSLLNQCESISCDNLLLLDDIYNYDMCHANRRKYASTSAINKILPKNSIRRRAHKKVLGIRESDTKIIKFLDDKRNRDEDVSYGKLTNCCDLNNDDDVVVEQQQQQQCDEKGGNEGSETARQIGDDDDEDIREEQERSSSSAIINIIDKNDSSDDATITIDVFNLLEQELSSCYESPHLISHRSPINCCDKTIQTSYIDLYNPPQSSYGECMCSSERKSPRNHHATAVVGRQGDKASGSRREREKERRKKCTCRDYRGVNSATICETSLSTGVQPKTTRSHPPKKSVLATRKERSEDRSTSGKYNRLMKQKNTIIDDDECGSSSAGFGGGGGNKNGFNDGCHESRVININQSVEIIPISTVNSTYSQPTTPRLGTSTSLHHDADRSDTHSQRSQKSKRSKFSPSFISRKLTSRLNSSELEDGAGGAKESLLGRGKSIEKKLPEPVETVCIQKKANRILSPRILLLFAFCFFLS